jgi:EpsI family protein
MTQARMNGPRLWAAVLLLLAAAVTEYALPRTESPAPHAPLQNLPSTIAGWTSQEMPIEPRIVTASRVDDYLNRLYRQESSDALNAASDVGLYVGYYASQRAGDSVHSPKNCLPGAGWQPVSASRIALPLLHGAPAEVNLYIVENEQQRFVVLYWYQSHGRIIASEYQAKFYTVRDAILLHRTDSALVRITVPVEGGNVDGASIPTSAAAANWTSNWTANWTSNDEARARQSAIAFATLIAPKLDEVIPR